MSDLILTLLFLFVHFDWLNCQSVLTLLQELLTLILFIYRSTKHAESTGSHVEESTLEKQSI